jgi:hypothetical protein
MHAPKSGASPLLATQGRETPTKEQSDSEGASALIRVLDLPQPPLELHPDSICNSTDTV